MSEVNVSVSTHAMTRCQHASEPIRRYHHTPHAPFAPRNIDTVTAECAQCGYVYWRARRDLVED